MLMNLSAPIAVHNLHRPEKSRLKRRRMIRMFLDASKGGLGGFNELAKEDRSYFKTEATKRGLSYFIHGDNGAVWAPALFEVGRPRVRKITSGGYVGADGEATPKKGDDDRRIGPNRYALYLPIRVVPLNLEFEFVVTHLLAKAFTSAKWRLKLFRRSVRSLSEGVRKENGLLVGDMNSKDFIDLPDLLDVPEHTPPTFGKSHYDQIVRWGPHIDVSKMDAVNTPSDHHMLIGVVSFRRNHQRGRR